MSNKRATAASLAKRTLAVIDGGHVTTAAGFSAGSVHAGLKRKNPDVTIIVSDRPAAAAGVFTTNKVQAACVGWSKAVAQNGQARAILSNAGNANACTGAPGRRDNEEMAKIAAEAIGTEAHQVLVGSTGVIGVPLPMDKLRLGITEAAAALSPAGGQAAAGAIMTTDTCPKSCAVRVDLGEGRPVVVGGIAKGSGMIAPNMATTLGFITTDAEIEASVLQEMLVAVAGRTFNCITVDGDTSTNDMLLVLANGASSHAVTSGAALERFAVALEHVTFDLAQQVVRDGEGATKVMCVDVVGATGDSDARLVAQTVANSPLVKTALHGAEPNWGRVLMAVGRSGAAIEEEKIDVWFGGMQIVGGGLGVLSDLAPLAKAMSEDSVDLRIDLGLGAGAAKVWTCDLSKDYVDINGSYIS